MREYLFHGKRVDNGEWIEGSLWNYLGEYKILSEGNIVGYNVESESVGQYTGMNEFMLIDESRNAKLFEGDIIEVWGNRHVGGYSRSQYDGKIRVRGTIVFDHGEWCIDYKNNYNNNLAKLKGAETDERDVDGSYKLYYYGYHGSNIDEYRNRQLEWKRRYKDDNEWLNFNDIVKIGNVFENADLLEG